MHSASLSSEACAPTIRPITVTELSTSSSPLDIRVYILRRLIWADEPGFLFIQRESLEVLDAVTGGRRREHHDAAEGEAVRQLRQRLVEGRQSNASQTTASPSGLNLKLSRCTIRSALSCLAKKAGFLFRTAPVRV